jgi:hypothetical protein
MMNTKTTIENLEREWDFDTGFFGLLRKGELDTGSLNRLVKTLSVLDYDDHDIVDRRVVSLLWYMPLFMGWQKENVEENGGDLADLESASNLVQNHVERILGIP